MLQVQIMCIGRAGCTETWHLAGVGAQAHAQLARQPRSSFEDGPSHASLQLHLIREHIGHAVLEVQDKRSHLGAQDDLQGGSLFQHMGMLGTQLCRLPLLGFPFWTAGQLATNSPDQQPKVCVGLCGGPRLSICIIKLHATQQCAQMFVQNLAEQPREASAAEREALPCMKLVERPSHLPL